MSDVKNFIIVDDYSFNSMIAEKMLKSIAPEIHFKSFLYAQEAFDYIKDTDLDKVTILIDIQMPYMSGFQFIEAFEGLPEEKRRNFDIYIYSSTVNEDDKIKASSHSEVKQFLPKPLTFDALKMILGKQEAV
ncbi:MAG: response regulator [Sphingobacteriales bacterium]|nr:MAG: response regulator [Sphingobacteriales bacterium]